MDYLLFFVTLLISALAGSMIGYSLGYKASAEQHVARINNLIKQLDRVISAGRPAPDVPLPGSGPVVRRFRGPVQ